MTSLKKTLMPLAGAAALALTLAACGGDSSSDDTSAIGGGEAVCDEATMTANAQGAAGSDFVSMNSYECADGYAIVSAITTSGGMEQTSVYLFEAEGPVWALEQADAVCADGGGADVPTNFRDELCALR
ncbi:MAG: hypothetical protein WAO41_05715 [Candidatus Nanopelagicales bacterium]